MYKRFWVCVNLIVAATLLLSCSEGPMDSSFSSNYQAIEWYRQCWEDSVSRDILYDGCLLPDADDQEHKWEISPDTTVSGQYTTEDCELVLPSNEKWGHIGYRRNDESLSVAYAYELDARLKIDQFLVDDYLLAYASIGIHDGDKMAHIALSYKGLGYPYAWSCHALGCERIAVDWTVYHDYRIFITKNGMVQFWIDEDLWYEIEYENLSDSTLPPHLMVFGGGEAVSFWDFVHYTTCQSPPLDDFPPIDEQILNVMQFVDSSDLPKSTKNWLGKQLYEALGIVDEFERAKKIYQVTNHLSQMKKSGVVLEPCTLIEALLQLARVFTYPELNPEEGYRGRVKIIGGGIDSQLVPGESNLDFWVDAEIEPHGQHVSNSGNLLFGVSKRMVAIDLSTFLPLHTIFSIEEFQDGRVSKGEVLTVKTLGFEWDGIDDSGNYVGPENVIIVVTIDYVHLDPETHTIAEHSWFGSHSTMIMTTMTDDFFGHDFWGGVLDYKCNSRCRCFSFEDCKNMKESSVCGVNPVRCPYNMNYCYCVKERPT